MADGTLLFLPLQRALKAAQQAKTPAPPARDLLLWRAGVAESLPWMLVETVC